MKNLLLGMVVSLVAFSAQAMQIVDVNNPYVFLKQGQSHTITHNLFDDGVPDLYTVTGGTLSLGFSDGYWKADKAWDLAKITGEGISGTFEVDGTHAWGYDIRVIGLGQDGIDDLNANGLLEVTVKALNTPKWKGYNDFWWKTSMLTVDVEKVSVSEPATLALFGLGLMGLGLARRKTAA